MSVIRFLIFLAIAALAVAVRNRQRDQVVCPIHGCAMIYIDQYDSRQKAGLFYLCNSGKWFECLCASGGYPEGHFVWIEDAGPLPKKARRP